MIIGATIHAEENPSEMIAPIMFNYKTIQLLDIKPAIEQGNILSHLSCIPYINNLFYKFILL